MSLRIFRSKDPQLKAAIIMIYTQVQVYPFYIYKYILPIKRPDAGCLTASAALSCDKDNIDLFIRLLFEVCSPSACLCREGINKKSTKGIKIQITSEYK